MAVLSAVTAEARVPTGSAGIRYRLAAAELGESRRVGGTWRGRVVGVGDRP